jgi:hypothetical protein
VIPTNVRFFRVLDSLSGPRIALHTSFGDCASTGEPAGITTIFRTGIRLAWKATPGISGTAPVSTEWAIGEPENWTPAGPDGGTWPPEEQDPWRPDPGPVTFHVRAVDDAGFERILSYELDVREARGSRGLLAVLDTQPDAMQATHGIWPHSYEVVERALVENLWLAGRDLVVHETLGLLPPDADRLAHASTVVWLHSSLPDDGDSSVLRDLFSVDPATRSLLTTWHEAGGNLVLCGLNPTSGLRFFTSADGCDATYQSAPYVFGFTLSDPDLVPHFAASRLAIDRIDAPHGNTVLDPANRLTIARSAIPWLPDLEFDPASMPNGPTLGGFGFWDGGVTPRGDAVVAYTANDSADALATLLYRGPGRQGNALYLGLHPWFIDRPQMAEMFGAVLDAFGELRREEGPAPDQGPGYGVPRPADGSCRVSPPSDVRQ